MMSLRNMLTSSQPEPQPDPIPCEYCGTDRKPAFLEIGGKKVHFTYEPCTCEAYKQACEAQDIEREREERERAEKHKARRYELAGIPLRFMKHEPDAEALALLNECVDGNGLYIQGTYGAYKTTLAAKIAKAAVDQGRNVAWTSSMRILGEISAAMNGEGTVEDVFRRLSKPDLLIIDDFAKNAPSAHVVSMLYRVVNERYEQLRSTIYTGNFTKAELVKALTVNGDSDAAQAIVSRLFECTRKIDLGNTDHRLSA